ncbi:Dyp-type peroxidase [Microbacterium sp. 10M-3C3]|jgi:putative iron-dependent peroxidase|uniref:Dyp-type peroxidase n=1 Tax=Microbacterium sp. 10M-3C3 TaxID=2483401 RepID=UPI000F63947F|nr:Dyp-type peroxidase [Microbacterium sp. 10M-3C3]
MPADHEGAGAVQRPTAALTSHATFLVVELAAGADAVDTVRDVLTSLSESIKAVAFRDPDGTLTCTVGIGAAAWPRLTSASLPRELRPFSPVVGAAHTAPATAGDLLFHIRAERADIVFEFERQLLDALGPAVRVVDETIGFRSFDRRDLLGFVDGTANPVGPAVPEAVLVGDEDADHAGGSYVVVQKYVHPLSAWRALPTEVQEAILGRTKAENIELPDADSGQRSHKTLTTIVDDDGVEHSILRDNMPFGSPGRGEFGTYFAGYSRHLWVIQRMLERMFIGDPPGLHDRLLDFSTALTGSVFFAPSGDGLDDLPAPADGAPAAATAPAASGDGAASAPPDGSLAIGGRPDAKGSR